MKDLGKHFGRRRVALGVFLVNVAQRTGNLLLALVLMATGLSALTVPNSPVASAAPAYVRSAITNTSGGTTMVATFSGTSTAGNMIVVLAQWDNTMNNTITCSDSAGNTYTTGPKIVNTSDVQALGSCYAPNIVSASNIAVTVTWNGSPCCNAVAVAEYSGVATSSPLDVTATGQGNASTTPATSSATTTTNGDLIVGLTVATNNSPTVSAGAGFTQRVTGFNQAIQDQVQTTAGSISSSATLSASSNWAAEMLAFKPASGGSAPAAGDGVMTYGVTSDTTPRTRSYSASSNTFGAQSATVAAATPKVVRSESSPTRQEMLVGYTDSTTLRLLCYDGTTWSQEFQTGSMGGSGTDDRFAIAYEETTGDAMVVYGSGTGGAGTAELKYRTKAGSLGCGSANWSTEQSLDATRITGTVSWVKMATDRRAGSNIIALGFDDFSSDLDAFIWDGTAWTNEPAAALSTTVDYASSPQDTASFDLTYETTSGDLMVVWGDQSGASGVNGARYNMCTGGTASCTWGTAASIGSIADDTTDIDISSSPTTDEIVFAGAANSDQDLSVAYWSGSAWTSTQGLDDNTTSVSPLHNVVSTGWLRNGPALRSVIVYGDADAGGLSWVVGNGSTFTLQTDWSGQAPSVTGSYNWGDIQVDPANLNNLMFTASYTGPNLIAKRLTMDAAGAFTWSNADGSASLGSVSQLTSGAFSFSYWNNFGTPYSSPVGPQFVQSNGSGSQTTGTTITQAFTGANTAGNSIVVAASWDSTGTIKTMACTDTSGNTYSTAIVQNDTGMVQAHGICYATNIAAAAAGANTVTVTLGGSQVTRRIIVSEYSGVAKVATLDRIMTTVGGTASTTPTSGSETTTTNNDLVFGAMMTYGATTVTAGSGFTKRFGTTGTSATDFAVEDKVLTTAGATAATWTTAASQKYVGLMVTLRAASNAPDNGAVQHVTKTYNGTAASTIATTIPGVVNPNTLVATVAANGNTTISVTDPNNGGWTQAALKYDATAASTVAVFYIIGATSGSTTVTASFGTAATKSRIIVSEYDNIAMFNSLDVTSSNSLTSNLTVDAGTSNAATTTTSGDLIYGAFFDATAASLNNAGTNYARQGVVNGTDLFTEDRIQTTAGSTAVTATWGVAADRWISIMVAFRTIPTITQGNWRVFNNADSTDVGTALAAQNTGPTGIATGAQFRLRVRLAVTGSTLYTVPSWKLQFATMSGSCDTAFSGETYTDVATGSGAIRYYNNPTPADNATATSNANDPTGNTKVMASYEEANNLGLPATIAPGSDGLWDFSLVNTAGAANTTYCFRVLSASIGSPLQAYAQIPQITTGAVNQNPNAPTATLAQKKSDHSTTIPTGGYTNQNQVWLDATVSDPDAGDTVALCAEVASTLSSPASPTPCGTAVTNGTTGSVNVTSLADGAYKWQVKSKDNSGAYSSTYTQFNAGATAFTVDTVAPTGGTVNDGATANSESAYNSGSLQALSCNWSGFTDATSGVASYDVSFGTTAGATDVSTGVTGATSGWFVGVGSLNAGWYTYTSGNVLNLKTSQSYFCNIRAVDNAGNTYVVSSNGQIVAPTLTFSASTTLTLSNINAASSYTGTGTVTLQTSTNAAGGYVIRQYATGMPQFGAKTISNFNGGTYASPDAWVGGDTGFGYTSADTDINGSNIFQPTTCPGGNTKAAPGCYAPFATSGPGDIVADHTTAVNGTSGTITNESFTLSYRMTVPATQAGGNYSTTLVFSAIPKM